MPAHNAQIGAVAPSSTNPGTRVQDGTDGASVICTAKGSGTFSMSGKLAKGGVSFSIDGTMPASGSGTGSISSYDSTSALTMSSSKSAPCTITPIEVAPGRVWAAYDCPGFVSPDSPTTCCHADGFFVFENCGE